MGAQLRTSARLSRGEQGLLMNQSVDRSPEPKGINKYALNSLVKICPKGRDSLRILEVGGL